MENKKRDVAIVAGSDSDVDIIIESKMLLIFDEIGVSYSTSFVSAHRHDKELTQLVDECIKHGVNHFIGIASLAAALPGALAGKSEMRKLVIAVPLIANDGFMDGLDALLAGLRMPPGVPVLVSGIGKIGLKNAAIASAQILAVNNEKIAAGLDKYLKENTKSAKPFVKIAGCRW